MSTCEVRVHGRYSTCCNAAAPRSKQRGGFGAGRGNRKGNQGQHHQREGLKGGRKMDEQKKEKAAWILGLIGAIAQGIANLFRSKKP